MLIITIEFMKLSDLFGKKQPAPTATDELSLDKFRFYYLYGFTNDPNRTSADAAAFSELYKLVIGNTGGIAIMQSYHPYYLVNRKGTTAWIVAYVRLFAQQNKQDIYSKMLTEKAVYATDTATIFSEAVVWPDERLMPENNPGFGKYVPFVIPFLVPDTMQPLQWDAEIKAALDEGSYEDSYVSQVTQAIRFFMPEPAFVVGFDEFDEKNISYLVDKFVSYLKVLER